MELRHLRYFVAVAEERSFTGAARRLRVAQPALSRQIRDLEAEVGVALFQRLPRSILLTPAGEAFLVRARSTIDGATQAVISARDAAKDWQSLFQFAHGELAAFATAVENLLAAFRDAHPDAQVRASSLSDEETHTALREHRVDVGCVFLAEWPVADFGAHRLIDCAATGVLLPASHPLAASRSVRLADLRTFTWLHSALRRWPGFIRTLETALRDRGLVPQRRSERQKEMPSANTPVAAGQAWTLASEAVAAHYGAGSTAIAYRPFVEPPIPCWLALVWLPAPSPGVHRLVDIARRIGLSVGDEDRPQVRFPAGPVKAAQR